MTADRAGFKPLVREIDYDAARPSQYRFELQVGAVAETIEVQAESGGAARQPRKNVAAAGDRRRDQAEVQLPVEMK